MTYNQLGIIAKEQKDYAAAETWHHKALDIYTKQGNEHGVAMTYHNLGMIALKLQNYAAAERLCSQALAILEKQGNKCDSANAYQVLGVIAVSQNSYLKAGQRFVKSIIGFSDCNATKEAHESALNFMKLYNKSPSGIRKKLITMWEKSIGQFSVKQ